MAEKRTDKTLFYLPNGRGFTLIELLVVIAIIGLLASLSMIALNSAREKSRNSRRVSDMKQVQTALEMRFNDVHSYPDDITFGDDQINYIQDNETYNFDENRDGVTDYSIDNPNFKVFQFKSNFVARWEYTPGSTLFLVWSQNRDDCITDGPFQFRQDFRHLESIFPHNVFLLKFTYRLGL